MDANWCDAHRILALVEYNSSFALFVLISEKFKPTSISDLSIETVVPIDRYFSCGKFCEIAEKINNLIFLDTEPIEGNQLHIIFIITSRKVRYHFKIATGDESSVFASEVIRSKEGKFLYSSYTHLFLVQ